MKSVVPFLALAIASLGIGALCGQSGSVHKSDVEMARMTPEQRVEEYCREYARHGLWHRDYTKSLGDSIMRDGLRAVPPLVKIIGEFDPTSPGSDDKNKYEASSAAAILLGSLDAYFRLRAFEQGRAAINAVRHLGEQMHKGHYDTTPDEGERSKALRYQITLGIQKDLEGNSDYDRAIRDTLELRYKVKLSDKDLLDFSNYLISQDPRYPAWSKTDWYVDHNKLNEAGNPLQYRTIQNIDPFYKEYLKFKASR